MRPWLRTGAALALLAFGIGLASVRFARGPVPDAGGSWPALRVDSGLSRGAPPLAASWEAAFSRPTFYPRGLVGITTSVARMLPPGATLRPASETEWVLQAFVSLRNTGSVPVSVGRGEIELEWASRWIASTVRDRSLFDRETVTIPPGGVWERYATWYPGTGTPAERVTFRAPSTVVTLDAERVDVAELRTAIPPAPEVASASRPASRSVDGASFPPNLPPEALARAGAPAGRAASGADLARAMEAARTNLRDPAVLDRLAREAEASMRAFLEGNTELDPETKERMLGELGSANIRRQIEAQVGAAEMHVERSESGSPPSR